MVGTPWYVPPEFWDKKNLSGYDHDVWAIGVILFEMLTGKRPFTGEDAVTIAIKI